MLRSSGVIIGLIHDREMLDMVERGIRGGMCGLGGLNYKKIEDPEKECILPLDANNLYGHTMTYDLP